MALEAVVFPHGLLGYTMKELCSMGGGGGGGGVGGCSYGELGWFEEEEEKGVLLGYLEEGGGGDEQSGKRKWDVNWVNPSCSSMVVGAFEEWDKVNSLSPPPEPAGGAGSAVGGEAAAGGRRKRRRMKSIKNKEEVENQRMTHIAVERNRRKQMNEYLAVLRSLMPPSYVQRGDQASIIGGAINFVKELEQLLQSLEAQKRSNEQHSESAPFAEFFTFPQYSSYTARSPNAAAMVANESAAAGEEKGSAAAAAAADIEVTMVESHANLKVLAKRRPKQLLKLVVGLQNLRLTTLHLNVTTVDRMVLYSFSLKVEDDCQLSSVDDIAAAVHHIVGKVEEEAAVL